MRRAANSSSAVAACEIVFQLKCETEIVVQLVGVGSKSQACAELADRVIEVADLEIGNSQTLMHQRIVREFLAGRA